MSEDVKQCGGPQDPSCSLKQYVPVPIKGEFLVRNGKVLKVLETDSMDSPSGEDAWMVWTVASDDEV